jgi:enoyl-CoA hydratase/carnithine racemase
MQQTPYAGGKMLASAQDGIGTVVFNQPEKRNAMSVEMWEGLGQILAGFAEDPAIRVVVLTGAGDKAFVSGADISQFEKQRGDNEARAEYERKTKYGREIFDTFAKPMIARIQGFCIGGGLAIAMNADLRIASDDSQFGIPAARLGISYGYQSVRRLVQLVGPAEARMLLYTGDRIPAVEARQIGLINRVVPVVELDTTVARIAQTIATNAPLSVISMKQTVTEACKDEANADVKAIAESIATCFNSADYREGRQAFMAKRKPAFNGL